MTLREIGEPGQFPSEATRVTPDTRNTDLVTDALLNEMGVGFDPARRSSQLRIPAAAV